MYIIDAVLSADECRCPHRASGDPNVVLPHPFQSLVHGGITGEQGGVAALTRVRPERSASIAVTIAIDLDWRIWFRYDPCACDGKWLQYPSWVESEETVLNIGPR